MQFWGEVKKMPRFDNAYALIIGINSYQHINPLSKAVNDAVDVRNLLIDENTCGYHPDNVCLLTDTQATKLVFFETMNWLAEKADEAATVTIFFSGHGGKARRMARRGICCCTIQIRGRQRIHRRWTWGVWGKRP